MKLSKNKFYIFALVIYTCLSLYLINLDNNKVVGDSLENINITFNLHNQNTFSYTIYKNETFKTNFREPLYPFLLSIFIKILPLEFNSLDDLLFNIKYLKIFNIFIIIILSSSIIYIARDLKFNNFIKSIIILFILFGIYFSSINVFLTEVIAANLLLLHSYFYLKYSYKKKFNLLIISLIFLLLLVFTKSIFYYWLYIFIIINILYFVLYKINFKNIIILFLIALVPFAWQYRNYKEFGNFEFSSKERSILALSARVNLSNLSLEEYFNSYFYYNPFLKYLLNYKNETKLNDLNIKGYYLTSHKYPFTKLNHKMINEVNDEILNNIIYEYKHKFNNNYLNNSNNTEINKRLQKILIKEYFNNLDKNILLIPSMFFRMSNLNSGDSIYYLSNNYLLKTYSIIILFISQLFFLLSIFIFFFKFRSIIANKSIYFMLPSLFYLFFYSIFSMGLPRFGTVVFPCLLLFIFISHIKISEKN